MLPCTLALLYDLLLHIEMILVLEGLVINSNNTWLLIVSKFDVVFAIEGAWDCSGFEALPALEAFETCFRGGMVEGPATAGFAVC